MEPSCKHCKFVDHVTSKGWAHCHLHPQHVRWHKQVCEFFVDKEVPILSTNIEFPPWVLERLQEIGRQYPDVPNPTDDTL